MAKSRCTGNTLTMEQRKTIEVLKAAGEPLKKIEKAVGRSTKTIKAYAERPEVREEIESLREKMAGMFDDLATRMVESILPEDIRGINAYQRTVAAGIAVDKSRLLRGESTSNISGFFLHVQEQATDITRRRLGGRDEPTELAKPVAPPNLEQRGEPDLQVRPQPGAATVEIKAFALRRGRPRKARAGDYPKAEEK